MCMIRKRNEELRTIAAEIMARHTDLKMATIRGIYAQDIGYQTPKSDVRGIVFRNTGRLIKVVKRYDEESLPIPSTNCVTATLRPQPPSIPSEGGVSLMRNKLNLLITCVLFIILLTACGTDNNNAKINTANNQQPVEDPANGGEDTRSVSGMIVGKESNGNRPQLLVYPLEEQMAWEDLSTDEWIRKASEAKSDISWYVVEKEHYDQVENGQHVRMMIQPEQLEPYPPIRFVIDLEVMASS